MQAATDALAQYPGREGTVLVLDPQTGRIRAVVNPKVAFEQSLAPGSTIKPFVTLAAMRAHLINDGTRLVCPETYSHNDYQTTCSHPQRLPALNPSEAIAYSCNGFFATVGERLDARALDSLLVEFGFGEVTGAANLESPGGISRTDWHVRSAIGEGEHVLVTPIQLITAYSALINGGKLLAPGEGSFRHFLPKVRRNLSITKNERSTIMAGLRGAIRYGSAESSGLNSLPFYAFGKTGTATQINGFRTDGWFVGFASSSSNDAAENINLAVLVLLRKAHGSDAATLAAPIFETFARSLPPAPTSPGPDLTLANPPQSDSKTDLVQVHLVNQNITRTMSLEDYILGVVATEGSTEQEREALKALAVASRTFAIKNWNRHEKDGYDFCSTTHCQRYRFASPTDSSESPLFREAVNATAGEVLVGTNQRIADAYFGASCGGATANISSLWGGEAPFHLRGVEDDFCTSMPHARWTDTISIADLLTALRSDPRTNVGNRLDKLFVSRRDKSGRAQQIVIEGEQRRFVSGWDFKIIIGRALGWNVLKSSRFEVNRSGSQLIFRGSGFGHGLGLCQEGAHVMARRGAGYHQILAKYFPGTSIRSQLTFADLMWSSASEPFQQRVTESSRVRKVSSEHFRLSYPTTINEREAGELLAVLEVSRKQLLRRAASAGFVVQLKSIDVYLNSTTGNFVGRTGQRPWVAAATVDHRIEMQPLALLKRRGILETTVRHELVHTVVSSHGRRGAPRWLEEGFALYLAGEGPRVVEHANPDIKTPAEIDRLIASARNEDQMRQAYAAAYGEVRRMISKDGEASLWRLVVGSR